MDSMEDHFYPKLSHNFLAKCDEFFNIIHSTRVISSLTVGLDNERASEP